MSAVHKLSLLRHRRASAIARGDIAEVKSCDYRIAAIMAELLNADA